MPLFEVECTKCGLHSEVILNDAKDVTNIKCEKCEQPVRRVFTPTAIIFKGNGWHCTDYK